ncbi:MAG: bifunctional glutamate N-acetyltransferase/amino-acid acetyltransferase ArgJ [Desulfuromonadales bacterium]|nr:bifunctional glutamate N-acetyltransferase/amino-acid acetyltransferase ArgJ [Desulfuromonadales bacterium]
MSIPLKVKGFQFAATAAGIKKPGKLDVGLIVSDRPAVSAGLFTTNKVVAAPVTLSSPRVRSGLCQAILVNSGNANACTGNDGLHDAHYCGNLVANALNLDPELVAVSSTGVIGFRLDVTKFDAAVPALIAALSAADANPVAAAMMTTDSFAKVSAAYGSLGDTEYTVLGLAKGAGMIHPDMATMLAFVMTDAAVTKEFADFALRRAVDRSFNRITVDRDTSTNDMVLLLANGASGMPEIKAESREAEEFCLLLDEVLLDLAKMIVSDGEGATKLARIVVRGARTEADAKRAACSVATSSLVKTALFGEDANWGRIIAAVGYSGADVNQDLVDILIGDIALVRNGLGTGKDLEAEATIIMHQPEFTITIDLHLGDAEYDYYTSDLTYDYIKINADYRS